MEKKEIKKKINQLIDQTQKLLNEEIDFQLRNKAVFEKTKNVFIISRYKRSQVLQERWEDGEHSP